MAKGFQGNKSAGKSVSRTPIVLLVLAILVLLAVDIGHELGWIGFDFGLTVFDDIALAVLALFAIKGYLQGIVITVFSLAGYVGGLVGGALLSAPLAAFTMNRTSLGDLLGERLDAMIPAISTIPVGTPDALEQLHTATAWLSQTPAAVKLLEENPLIGQVMAASAGMLPAEYLFAAPVQNLRDWLVWSLLRLLAFFVLFWVIKLVFTLVGRLFTVLTDMSVLLSTANRVGGMVLGLAIGLLLIYVAYTTIFPFLGSLGILRLPESFSDSLFLVWIKKFALDFFPGVK